MNKKIRAIILVLIILSGVGMQSMGNDFFCDSDIENKEALDQTLSKSKVKWTRVDSLAGKGGFTHYYNFAYGNNTYVAVGGNGLIVTSKDGINWSTKVIDAKYYFDHITFNGSVFIAVGERRVNSMNDHYKPYPLVLVSKDGVNWDDHTPSVNSRVTRVIGNDKLNIGLLVSGDIIVSSNGVEWSSITNIGGVDWESIKEGPERRIFDIAWSGNRYVIVGQGAILYSSDGLVWEKASYEPEDYLLYVKWTGTNFLAYGNDLVSISSNGKDWTSFKIPLEKGDFVRSIAYGKRGYVAASYNGLIYKSSDGEEWSETFSPIFSVEGRGLESVIYFKGKYLALGGKTLMSTDGSKWKDLSPYSKSNVKSYFNPFVIIGAYMADDLLIALGENGEIVTSKDGIHYNYVRPNETKKSLPVGKSIFDILYAKNSFYAVGDFDGVLYSRDGIDWNYDDGPISSYGSWSSIGINNDMLFIADIGGGKVSATKNRNRWKDISVSSRNNHVFCVNSKIYSTGYGSGKIHGSHDGVKWDTVNIDKEYSIDSMAGNGQIIVAVGQNGLILTSIDGIDWIKRESTFTRQITDITWNGKQFVAVGRRGGILVSADGISWVESKLERGNDLWGVTSNENKFVAVGKNGTIAISDDGINWELSDANTFELLRSITWDGKRFVIVGDDGTVLISNIVN